MFQGMTGLSIARTSLPSSIPDHPHPHSQSTPIFIPRSLPSSFPGHSHPHSQATPIFIPRPVPSSFPDCSYPDRSHPHSQASPILPRPLPSSFPDHSHPHSCSHSCPIPLLLVVKWLHKQQLIYSQLMFTVGVYCWCLLLFARHPVSPTRQVHVPESVLLCQSCGDHV